MQDYAIQTDTINHNGQAYKVEWFCDDVGLPWENSEGHGIVSDWTARNKKPGELVLCTDRRSKRFYDFQASMKKAKRESWECVGEFKTRGEELHAAVMQDFEHLQRWCNDDWFYARAKVTMLDAEGNETDIYETLGGIEWDAWGGSSVDNEDIVHDKILECEASKLGESVAIPLEIIK